MPWWADAARARASRIESTGDQRIAGEIRQQHLDRDLAFQAQIQRAVDDSGRAGSKGGVDPVSPGQRLPDHRHEVEDSPARG